MYNFDEFVERKNTHSLKYDGIKDRFSIDAENLLPLWVADMDFKTPEPIRSALKDKIDEGILGYSGGYEDVYESIISWYERRHDLTLKREWIEFSGTVVSSLARIIKTFTNEGDKIIVQPPVFSNFYDLIKMNNRQVIENPLILKDGKYTMDLEGLKNIIDGKVKMIILCNPHNPVGRAWTKNELGELTKILVDNNILIVSDEAHCELVHKEYNHNFILQQQENVIENSITCIASHKTFNIAGLEISNVIIPNESLRKRYKQVLLSEGINKPNLLGLTALKAGFDHCEIWLDEMLDYVESNFLYMEEFFREYIPCIKTIKSEAMFLAWLDFREFNLTPKELEKLLINEGKVLVNQGYAFGQGGEGFIRINLACPKSTLKDALERIQKAVLSL
ncbi:MAG: MalY/PatB family protein [Clostridium sp.]|uniref:MalY/PatB family protein n=1 Tax=Clostridium sp. TaxID=1506 RepID=UPI003025C958